MNTQTNRSNYTSKQRDRIIKNKHTVNLTGEITRKDRINNRKFNNQIRPFFETLEYIFIWCLVLGTILLILALLNKAYILDTKSYGNESYEVNNYEEIIKDLEYNAKQVKIDDLSNFKEELIQVKVEEKKEPVRVKKSYEEFMERWEEIHEQMQKGIQDVFDIDKLARAVAQHETRNCTLWNSATRNNCFWIMTWARWFREFKSYDTKEDSYKDFKRIWTSYYGWMPTYAKAKRYSWDDRVTAWLNNVLHFYNKGI